MKSTTFRSLLASATLFTGVIIWGLSKLPISARFITRLEPHISELSSILSSYAFTVAGFLATIATFLFTLGDKPYFKLYKRRGNFGDLMFLHALNLLVLGGVFICSILLFAEPELLRFTLVLTGLSIVQLFSLTLASYGLTKRSND
jgi:hypothetical protein